MAHVECWCSLKDMTERLSVSRYTIMKWIKTKNMPAMKAGRIWLFKLSEVNKWLSSGAVDDDVGKGADYDSQE